MKTFNQFISELSDTTLRSYSLKSKLDRDHRMGWGMSDEDKKKMLKRAMGRHLAKKKMKKK